YGFETEIEIVRYLDKCDIILDAGAGSANKASWFASLSPNTTVVAVDISTSLIKASQVYSDIPNLFFIRADLANLDFISDNFFDYVSCDQVIHHTAIPRNTFSELVRVTKKDKDLSCYVYRKKALPRELIDDHFRSLSKNLSHEEIMDLSKRLTSLGKKLSQFDGEIDFEAIPQLGIEGGRMTIQRYLYWNFIKCFWDPIRGEEYSTIINYDWYAPSLASRYNEDEYKRWINEEELKIIYFHREPACYSGRFRKTRD
ncbi:MAG: class I SAM-dependent methyltransferase, partial [Calditrichaeota bacterium]|nr:class I SAM-dependent methyltransferase [Calditrichota bacterium]